MKIAIDIMGGDNAPYSNILGAKLFIDSTPSSDTIVIFVGDRKLIEKIIKKNNLNINQNRFEIHQANDTVTMDEIKPTYSFKSKPESSMVKSIQLIKNNEANAIISAGNTAALLSSSLFLLGTIEGIKRPALATHIPSKQNGFVLCDVGANTDIKPIHLLQFAIMASAYVKYIENIETPKIALLNIGSEKNKGNNLTSRTYPLLEEHFKNFIGNMESRYILEGKADVVLCDGYTGNIILKLTEGIINHFYQLLMLEDDIKNSDKMLLTLKKIFGNYNYEEHGASPFLGVKGIVLKCHGSCSEISIMNALISAEIFYKKKIINKIEKELNGRVDLFSTIELVENK